MAPFVSHNLLSALYSALTIAFETIDGTVNVPEEKLKSLNYSRDVDYMRTPANYGGGIEAAVEVFHQMHCLVSTNDLTSPFPPMTMCSSAHIPTTHLPHHPRSLSLSHPYSMIPY